MSLAHLQRHLLDHFGLEAGVRDCDRELADRETRETVIAIGVCFALLADAGIGSRNRDVRSAYGPAARIRYSAF